MRWPLVAAAGSIVVSLVGVALVAVNGGSLFGDFNLDLFLVGTIYAAVGGFILLRVSGNWLGRLLLVAGWLWAVDLLLKHRDLRPVTAKLLQPGCGWIATYLDPGTALLLSGIPLLFRRTSPSRRGVPLRAPSWSGRVGRGACHRLAGP
jgi:hypothetical protein